MISENNRQPESMVDPETSRSQPLAALECDDFLVGGGTDSTIGSATARVDSVETSCPARVGDVMEEAIPWDSVTRLFANEPQPVVELNLVSIEQSKQLCDLIQSERIRVTLSTDASMDALHTAIGREGVFQVTLGDALKFSDHLVVVGDTDSIPRVAAKLDAVQATLHRFDELSVSQLSQWHHALTNPDLVDSGSPPFLAGRYVTFVIARHAFQTGEEIIASELLLRLTTRIQRPAKQEGRMHRAAILLSDRYQSLRTVYRWRFNGTLPVAKAHATIRIGTPYQSQERVLLQIGGRDPGVCLAECYLPAKTLGVDLSGTLIRGDGA
ncbi:MAG: hypothetical protein AAGJ83_14635, partial [Planctomycetota bacterium]